MALSVTNEFEVYPTGYSNWFDLAMNYCNSFSEDEKNKIFSRNATQFYSL